MIRSMLAFLILFGTVPALAGDEAPPPKEMVLLTVSGLVTKTNRGAFDAKKDSLLALQKVSFDKAFAFDRPTLLALPQGEVKAQPPEFDRPATFKGPVLRELLGFLETAKVKISFVAVDGYTGYLEPQDIDRSDWIIALEADGVPLGVGQQGPLWLINTRGSGDKPSDDHHGHWIWALFYMKVGE
ncbi:MAG TPA: hypothetical protein VIG52_05195 [Methyloceanibacter sp.]|jgi:hypothetical protein